MSVTIGVDASHDSEKLSLGGIVATVSKECSQVQSVDSSIIVAIDGTIGSEGRVVISHFELTLQDVETTHQVDLFLEDIGDGALDIQGKAVKAANTMGWAVKGDVSEEVVSAW